MNNEYIVRFIRKDDKPVEEFFYHTYEEAFVHLALFRNDDSGLYRRIEIVQAWGDDKAITALKTR